MSELIRKLDNPEIDDMKIDINDYFELVYLRHRYFRKSTNPSSERLNQFEETICNISDRFYFRNIGDFKVAGFDQDDVRNIGRIHTVSFISLGGLKENEELMKKFVKKHKQENGKNSTPQKRDIFLKECYDLSRFLKQRLGELCRWVRSKNRNIRGTEDEHYFFIGNNDKTIEDEKMIDNPEKYGFKRIEKSEFNKLKKEVGTNNKRKFTTRDGQTAIMIIVRGKRLSYRDIEKTDIDPQKGYFYRDPETNLILEETIMNLKE